MSQTSANPFIFRFGVCPDVNLTVPTPTPASTTAEAHAELLYQIELLTRQNARLKETLDRERKRLKNERKRGDDLFAKTIRLGAQIRNLLGEWEELLDSNYALESEILDVEEVMEMRRQAERDRRRRAVGHGGVMGRCCPYSGRRARQMGFMTAEEDGEWGDDCFSCCPCCRFSNCETACGTNCRIEGHFGNGDENGDNSGSGSATPTSRTSSGGEGNFDDVDVVDDFGADLANAGDEYDEGDSGPGVCLERDSEDAGGVDDHVGDVDGSPGWTGDVPFWLGLNESYDGDKIKMNEIHLETEDHDGYDGEAETTDVDDDHLEQGKVAEIAPPPPSFAEEATSQIHSNQETKRQLLMEIVNKLHTFDEGSYTKITSRDKQQILLLDGTGKSIEDTTSAPQDEGHSWKTSAAKKFVGSKYLKLQNSQKTIWDLEDEKGYVQGMMVGQGHVGLKGFYEHSGLFH